MRSAFLSGQLFANIIPYAANVDRFTPSRSGRKVEYRFYKQLEQILGGEAVSIDEYDEKDEQVDQDSGTNVLIHSVKKKLSVRKIFIPFFRQLTGLK